MSWRAPSSGQAFWVLLVEADPRVAVVEEALRGRLGAAQFGVERIEEAGEVVVGIVPVYKQEVFGGAGLFAEHETGPAALPCAGAHGGAQVEAADFGAFAAAQAVEQQGEVVGEGEPLFFTGLDAPDIGRPVALFYFCHEALAAALIPAGVGPSRRGDEQEEQGFEGPLPPAVEFGQGLFAGVCLDAAQVAGERQGDFGDLVAPGGRRPFLPGEYVGHKQQGVAAVGVPEAYPEGIAGAGRGPGASGVAQDCGGGVQFGPASDGCWGVRGDGHDACTEQAGRIAGDRQGALRRGLGTKGGRGRRASGLSRYSRLLSSAYIMGHLCLW